MENNCSDGVLPVCDSRLPRASHKINQKELTPSPMNREPEDDFNFNDFNPICKKCDCETYFVECATCGGEGDIDGEEDSLHWDAIALAIPGYVFDLIFARSSDGESLFCPESV